MFYIVLEAGVRQGLLLVPLAIGVHIAFRFLRYPDLTADGSILLGSAVSTLVLASGGHYSLAIFAGSVVAGLLGVVTASISEFLKIDRVLAGIATTLGSYSLALRLMKRGNVGLGDGIETIYRLPISDLLVSFGLSAVLLLFVALVSSSVAGLRIRAVGENEELVRRLGGQVRLRIVLGLFWANACIGISGAMLSQSQRFTDVGQGAGTLFVGLACLLIGNTLPMQRLVVAGIAASGVGAIAYSVMVSGALRLGLLPGDIRALSAVLVLCSAVMAHRMLKNSERIPLFG